MATLSLLLAMFAWGPTYVARVVAANPCASQCTSGFTMSIDHPVVLDGSLVGFSVNLKAKRARRAASAAHHHKNNLRMDEFHVHEQVREFCWFNKMELTDCNLFIDSVENKARKAWFQATSKCHCAEDPTHSPLSHRLFLWRDREKSEQHHKGPQTIYLQVVSLRAAQTLLGISLVWHQKLSVDDYGHSLGGFIFPKELSEPPYTYLLDGILPEVFARTSSKFEKSPPRLVLVPPNAPGSLPWTAPDNALAVIVLFDSDSSTITPKN